MKLEFPRPIVVRSAFMLGLIATTTHLSAQIASTSNNIASSSSSYGLLDAFATSPALPSAPAPQPATHSAHHLETSLSVGGFSQLTTTRLTYPGNTFHTESITPSAGLLATFRQSFKPWLGYSVNFGYTRASEHNTSNATTGTTGVLSNRIIQANMYELSFSYVAQKHITPHLTGFADIGGGMISFQSINTGVKSNITNYRPEGVGGVGVDYSLTNHLGLRAEYRGQLYKFADYGGQFGREYTVTSEPTLSLTYNFGKPSTSKH